MSHEIATKPDHGAQIVESGRASSRLQLFFDHIVQRLNSRVFGDSVLLEIYTVATLPDASKNESGMIYVSDELGGAQPAFSDGTNWRRVSDRDVVS